MSRSPGAEPRRRLSAAIFLGCALAGGPAAAQISPGGAAFASGAYAQAEPLLRAEAERGAPQAMLHLGTMFDLGLGVPRDPARAFRWYLAAAEAGEVDAQFNVGVMLDAGAGQTRDAGAAAIWYSRAASQGHARAQYNLGLLYSTGEGVPRNTAQAALWLDRAADRLPAAAQRRAALEPAVQGPPEAPGSASALLVDRNGTREGLLGWSAAAGSAGFLVEIVAPPRPGEHRTVAITRIDTDAAALAVPLPGPSRGLAWRVSTRSGDGRLLPGPWQVLAPGAATVPRADQSRVTFRHAPGDGAAMRLAAALAEALAPTGIWVQVAAARPAAQTAVRFGPPEDAALAARIAAALPVLTAADAEQVQPGPDAPVPGEILVDLVGGPG